MARSIRSIALFAIVIAISDVCYGGPMLPPIEVDGGLLFRDTSDQKRNFIACAAIKGIESFQAVITEEKLLVEFGLAWDWDRTEKGAASAAQGAKLVRLKWDATKDPCLVLKLGTREIVCPLTDAVVSPDLLTLKGTSAISKADRGELFETLRNRVSPALIRVTLLCAATTPPIDVQLQIDRARAVTTLQNRVTALGGKISVREVERTARELLASKVVTYTVGSAAGDPARETWIAELAAKAVAELVTKQVLRKAADASEEASTKETDDSMLTWDSVKVAQFQMQSGEIRARSSSTVSFSKILSTPIRELKLGSSQHEGFIDLRPK
jgi:hypothetical protein